MFAWPARCRKPGPPSRCPEPARPARPGKPFDPEGVAEAVAHVRSLIDEEVAAGIPPSRIVVGGFSQVGGRAKGALRDGHTPPGRAQPVRWLAGSRAPSSHQMPPPPPFRPATLCPLPAPAARAQGGHVAYKAVLGHPEPLGGCAALSTWLEPSLKDVR